MHILAKLTALAAVTLALNACSMHHDCEFGPPPPAPAAPPAPPAPPEPPQFDIQLIAKDAQFACIGKNAGDDVTRTPDADTTVTGVCKRENNQLWFRIDNVRIKKQSTGDTQ